MSEVTAAMPSAAAPQPCPTHSRRASATGSKGSGRGVTTTAGSVGPVRHGGLPRAPGGRGGAGGSKPPAVSAGPARQGGLPRKSQRPPVLTADLEERLADLAERAHADGVHEGLERVLAGQRHRLEPLQG